VGRGSGQVVWLKGMRLFRMAIGREIHVRVFPAIDRLGRGLALFVVLRRFVGAGGRFAPAAEPPVHRAISLTMDVC
jgi:hypothetical protein